LNQQISNIREAIAKESNLSSHSLSFRISDVIGNNVFLFLTLAATNKKDQLSDRLEDC